MIGLKRISSKAIVAFLLCILGVYMVLPNIIGNQQWMISNPLRLGIDLKGGSSLTLKVDFIKYINERLQQLAGEMELVFKEKQLSYQKIGVEGDRIVIESSLSRQELDFLYKRPEYNIETENGNSLGVRYSPSYLVRLKREVIEDSINNIWRRLDQIGNKEITVQAQGEDLITVQVPGSHNPEDLKLLLGKTAKLSFRLVENKPSFTTTKMKDEYGTIVYINTKSELGGESLADARAAYNQNGQAVISFKLDSDGARKFANITRSNVGKRLAIILDDALLTAPAIREKIATGSGEISGNFTIQEANRLALLLRSGALPAPMSIIEETTIGPSLGAESIKSGKDAIIISIILVSGFIIAIYRSLGVIASVALAFNIVFIFAIIAALDATLTLPGLAGIALTVGMAVDANILIFERMREESRAQAYEHLTLDNTKWYNRGIDTSLIRPARQKIKDAKRIIDSSFDRAMITIIDSNLTTLIASGLMFFIGHGSIKGFALTLSIGIISSLFTAVFLTQLMVRGWLFKEL